MLAEIFKAVLIMSTVGGALILALLVLKPLTKRTFGDKWQFYIWLSVIIVLMLPVEFKETKLFFGGISPKIQMAAAIPKQTVQMIENLDGTYLIRQEGQGSHVLVINWFYVITIVWLAVATILFVKTVIDGVSLKSRLDSNSVFLDNLEKAEIRECGLVGTPILFGGVKSVLYIPEKLKDSEKLRYIIAHEIVHLRRGDILVKWLAVLARCVHWFNPLVYAAVKQIDEACEISCDVEATRKMSAAEKTEYMQTVLEISKNDIEFRSALMAGLTSGGSVLKKRFVAIRKPTRNSKAIYFLGVIVAALITFFSVSFCGIVKGRAYGEIEMPSSVIISENNKEILDEIKVFEMEEEKGQTESKILEAEQKNEKKLDEKSEIQIPQRAVIRGEFNSQGGDTRQILGVTPDENGCINIKITSNVQETVDVYVIDAENKKEISSMGVPVYYEVIRTVDGLDLQKKYNIVLKGPMRNNWEIESEYMIY